jgi:hypothetical protein
MNTGASRGNGGGWETAEAVGRDMASGGTALQRGVNERDARDESDGRLL